MSTNASSDPSMTPASGPFSPAIDGPILDLEAVTRTDVQWRTALSPMEYHVPCEADTKRPFTGALPDECREGVYCCHDCGAELFRSIAKSDFHCGWPSFYDPSDSEVVILSTDTSHGMVRTEVYCATYHSHLGYVFDDAPQTPTGQYCCTNPANLTFEEGQAQPGS